ncbi:sterol desaturase family protein [Candidatus Sumerlaeota bacterium]|nr:sterol desaturase family protein [Candidatus Sumerlaeota bacterium]
MIAVAAFLVFFVYCSFFEWVLHRQLMHTETFFRYPYRAHQEEHHTIFKADSTYFIQNEADREHLTFAWWNAPVLMALNAPLVWGAYYVTGTWSAVAGAVAAMASYYALYEYLHLCMHTPSGRWFEKTSFFQFVQMHHRVHHVYYKKNLNVVVPIADFLFRTRVALPSPDLFEKLEEVRLKKLEAA